MIFIFIFVTISFTFCNSLFINHVTNTHLLVLSDPDMEAFKDNWVELPNEMIEQHSSICQLLVQPVIILDKITLPYKYAYSIYYKFEIGREHILPLKEHMDTAFWYEKDGHRIHLLPCRREEQTIYITKVADEYETYIMLVNALYVPGNFEFHILGYIMKFAPLNLIGGHTLEYLRNEFRNQQIDEEKERNISYVEITISAHKYRVRFFWLCTSVLQNLLIGVKINASVIKVNYLLEEFSVEGNASSPLSLLYPKAIQCKFGKFIFELVKYTPNQLLVHYEINNEKMIEVYETEDEDTIKFLKLVFAYEFYEKKDKDTI